MKGRDTPTCRCCDGTGEVMSGDGTLRPCSRCRGLDFSAWFDARRPKPDEADRKPLFGNASGELQR